MNNLSHQTHNYVEHKVLTKHMKKQSNYSSSQQEKLTPCLLHRLNEIFFWCFLSFANFYLFLVMQIIMGFLILQIFMGFMQGYESSKDI